VGDIRELRLIVKVEIEVKYSLRAIDLSKG
jgi:hypothetical protein